MTGYFERFAPGAFTTEYARFAQYAALRNPNAQAIIRGPVADPPIRLRLAPLEAHFFLLDRGDALDDL